VGFFGLHLLATGWGSWERQRRIAGRTYYHRRVYQYTTIICMACVVYILNNYNTLHGSEEEVPGLRTSRKMANATYCLWIFAHNIFILILLEEVNEMFNFGGTGGSMVPTLLDAVNRNQLIVFLIGKYVYTSFLSFPFLSFPFLSFLF
jgi:hypothetical protein